MKQILHLRNLIITLTLSLISFLNALGQGDDIYSLTASLDQSLVVCGEPITFQVVVKNNTTQELSDIVMFPGLPSGVNYVAGSAQNMVEDISDPLNPQFSIQNITSLDSVIVSYQATADCGLTDYIKAGSTTSSALISNNTRYEYTIGGESKYFNEPNGSSSYNASYADIELFVHPDDVDIIPDKLNEVVRRRLSVKNTGIGYTDSLTVTIEYDDVLNVKGLYVTNDSYELVEKLTPTSISGNVYTYQVSNMYSVGDNDNFLEEGEILYFVDSVMLPSILQSVNTNYKVRWGCKENICNEEDQEAEFAAYVGIPVGSPNIIYGHSVVSSTEINSNEPSVVDYYITNIGNGNEQLSDAAFNLYYEDRFAYLNRETELYIKNRRTGEWFNISNKIQNAYYGYSSNYDRLYFYNLDTIKSDLGFSDMDNDGYFDDLAVGDTIFFRQKNTFSSTAYTYNYSLYLIRPYFYYKKINSLTNYSFTIFDYVFNRYRSSRDWDGNKIIKDQESGTYKLYSYIRTTKSPVIKFPRKKSYHKVILPKGFILNSASNDQNTFSFRQVADTVFIENVNFTDVGNYYTSYGGYINLDLRLDCSVSSDNNDFIYLRAYTYYNPDSLILEHNGSVYSTSLEIPNDCKLCPGYITTNFSVERINFGWIKPNHEVSLNELKNGSSFPRATRDSQGVYTNHVRKYDTIKFELEGQLTENVTSYNNLSVQLEFDSITNYNFYEFQKAEISINKESYFIDDINFYNYYFENGKLILNYDYPLGIDALPATINSDDTVRCSLFFVYKFDKRYLIGSDKRLINGAIYGIDTNGINTLCKKKQAYLFLRSGSITFGYGSADISCGNMNSYLAGLMAVGYAYWGEEFRPALILKEIEITLPDDLYFNTNDVIRIRTENWNYIDLPTSFIANNKAIAYVDGSILTNKFDVYIGLVTLKYFNKRIKTFRPSFKFNYINCNDLSENTFDTLQTVVTPYVSSWNPDNKINVNEIQEGYSNIVRWPVDFCVDGTTSRQTTNAWTAIELEEMDNSTVLLGAVNNSGVSLATQHYGDKDIIRSEGKNMMVQLGTIGYNSCKSFDILATYKNCVDDAIQPLDVYGSWHCYNYPELSDTLSTILNADDLRNKILTEEIYLRYKTSNIQWNVKKNLPLGEEFSELCEPVPFHLDITSTKYADIFDAILWCELPDGVTLDEQPSYTYPVGSTPRTIPDSCNLTDGNRIGWKLTSLTGGFLPGTRTDTNEISVDLSVTPSCGFDPASPVKFRLAATTNCNDEIILDDHRKINILGLELDTLSVEVDGGYFSACNSNSALNVTVTNVSEKSSISDMFEITLPNGVSFVREGNDSCLITTLDGNEHLYWAMPSEYLEPGESWSGTFPITVTCDNLTTGSLDYRVSTTTNQKAVCSSGGECNIGATTGEGFSRAIYREVIRLVPVCSDSVETKRRWLVKNIIDETILFTYHNGDEEAYGTRSLVAGDSVYLITPIIPELRINYFYGDNFGTVTAESIDLRCGNDIDCKDFDFTLEPQHIDCPGDDYGSILVDMPDVEIESFKWYDENDFNWEYPSNGLTLENVPAGDYRLMAVIYDRHGMACAKSKTASIIEPEIHIKLDAELYNSNSCDGAYGVVKLDGVLQEDTVRSGWYSCYDTAMTVIDIDTAGAILIEHNDTLVIGAGQIVKTSEISGFTGVITVAGGTLIAQRYFKPKQFSFTSGTILVNKGTLFDVPRLLVPETCEIVNYGVLDAEYIGVQGKIDNYYKITTDTLNIDGSFITYADAVVLEFAQNKGEFINWGDVEMYGNVSNSGIFQNQCTMYIESVENLNGNTISNSGYLEVEYMFLNTATSTFEIISGSEIVCDTLANFGDFAVTGDSCFCFTIFNVADGTGIPPINYESGNCNTTCRYASGMADVATIIDESTGLAADSLRLEPGLHNVTIKLREGCYVDYELHIDGGLDLQTNEYDSICPGGETYLVCEINPESELDINATYNWTPKEGIVDYDSTRDYQLVRPERTTQYILTAETENGCVGVDTVTIYVIDFELNVTQDKSEVCSNDSVQLTAVANQESYFLWEPNEFMANDTAPITTVSLFEDPGEYKYWVTAYDEVHGCELSDTVTFTVNPSPEISIIRSDTNGERKCSEADIEFKARGADEYSWYLNDVEVGADSVISLHFTDSVSTIYADGKYLDTQCESSSDDEKVHIIQRSEVEIGIDHEACITPYQRLDISGGDKYVWYPSSGLSDTISSDPAVFVTDTTTYYVDITDTTGCVFTDSIEVYPNIWPVACDDKQICYGDTTTLSVTGGIVSSYAWQPEYALDNPNSDAPATNVLATTQFIVEAQDEYGCVNSDTVTVFVDPSCRCTESSSGTTYMWLGTNSRHWKDEANWSSGNPDRNPYPGLEPDDHVVIDTASLDVIPILESDVSIENLCIIGGKLDLAEYQLYVKGEATFIGGEVISVHTDDEIFGLVVGDSSYMNSVLFEQTIFNTGISVYNSSKIMLNGATFNNVAEFEQAGSDTTNCMGGNIFNGNTKIANTGNGSLRLAFNNQGNADTYNGNITFENTETGFIYPSSTHVDTAQGDVMINGPNITFGINGGSICFNGEIEQYIGSEIALEDKPLFRKLEVNKNPSIAFSKLVLDIPVQIGLDTSDYLHLNRGYIVSSETSPIYLNMETKVIGGSDESYVEGAMIKVGNADFTYPFGGDGYFMPLTISGADNIDASLNIYGEYVIGEQQLGPPIEPITSVSTCEYWKLYDINGRKDLDVNVTLSWSPVSCDVLTDITKMHVVAWDSLKWVGLGNSIHTGSRVTGGTLTNKEEVSYYKSFTFGSEIVADYGPTVGMSLNNYGAVISVQPNTHMHINGNVLNDKGKKSDGKFDNKGSIHVLRDWTNNSEYDTVASEQGKYELFGSYQRLRGGNPTTFSNLEATGHGRKELYADIFVRDTLYINDNNISTKKNSLHILNTDPKALQRTTGYVSSSRFGGTLKRDITPAKGYGLNSEYLYPLGSQKLYRPISISPANGFDTVHTFGARFLPYNPAVDSMDTSVKSATVKSVNTSFYHNIVSDYSENDTLPVDPVNVRFYFNRNSDGLFQSIGHWDDEPEVLPAPYTASTDSNVWKKANKVKIYIDSTNVLTPHSLELRGWSDFGSSNFALVTGAYVINTNKFGNPFFFNDQGVAYTMEGSAFLNQQPIYETGHGETSMGEAISPEFFDSTEISNIMVIRGDAFSKPGKIELTTFSDGSIVKDEATGYYKIYFIDDNDDKYILSPSVYDVINGSILILKSSEDYEPVVCPNDIKVAFTDGSPLVFSLSKPEITITNHSIVNRFVVLDVSDNTIFEVDNTELQAFTGDMLATQVSEEGIYKFIIETTDVNSNTQQFNGQFIVVE